MDFFIPSFSALKHGEDCAADPKRRKDTERGRERGEGGRKRREERGRTKVGSDLTKIKRGGDITSGSWNAHYERREREGAKIAERDKSENCNS